MAARLARMVVCARCRRERPVHARGLCRSCYQHLWKGQPAVLKRFRPSRRAAGRRGRQPGPGAGGGEAGMVDRGEVRLPYALARDVLDLIAEARDGPLDDGFRLDALLARIVAQLPPGELPEELQDTDEGQPDGG